MHFYPRTVLTVASLVFCFSCSVFAQTAPQNFISVPPCRIADTRTDHGGTGPVPGVTYQTFPVVGAPGVNGGAACGIPANAAAFSLNVTAVPNPTGSSLLYLSVLPATETAPPEPPSSSTLNDPSGTIVANAAIVASGVNGAVDVYVSSTSDVIIDIDGYFLDQTSSTYATAVGTGAGGSTGSNNTAVGYDALPAGSGGSNTAIGSSALKADTSGNQNTAVGVQALFSNTAGTDEAALGFQSLYANTSGVQNSAFGSGAMYSNTAGGQNSAFGTGSLRSNTTGAGNTAVGLEAMYYSTNGTGNIGVGYQSLFSNSTGSLNSVLGYLALSGSTTGNYNTSIGAQSLYNATTGSSNNAFGTAALANLTTGNNNIAMGNNSGQNGITTGSNNIEIGSLGISTNGSDNNLIAIGTQGTQSAAYIAGIYNVNVTGGEAVVVNSSGKLGVQSSSIRFKQDVHDMADASDALMQLRPVEFRYKQAEPDGTQPLQFGLIAEDVAKIYLELVSRGKDGQINSVQYHQLPAMLLNEIQKQHRTIEQLEANKADQIQRINRLQAEMQTLRESILGK